MEKTLELISRVIPIFLLLGLGYFVRVKGFLKPATMDDIKKVVVNFALPSVLFLTFLDVALEWKFLILGIIVFGLNIAALLFGGFVQRKWYKGHEYFRFLIPGYEYGMLGWSLFIGAYGLEHAGAIALSDLGHEFFIWFVFVPLLMMKKEKSATPGRIVRNFLSSPVIIGILSGLVLNILGLKTFLETYWLTSAVLRTLDFLGNLVVPLILLIIGYGISIKKSSFKELGVVLLTRLGIWIPILLIMNLYLLPVVFNLGEMYQHAMFTLFILPPAFILPVFMKEKPESEKTYIHNMLTGYTVVSLVAFTVYFVFSQL